jgi:hypothetical protein
MKHALPAVALLVVALCSCDRKPAPAAAIPTDAPAATADPGALAAARSQMRQDAAAQQLASMQGYGDLRLGMSTEEVRKAWGAELSGSADEPGGCYYLTAPDSSSVIFMIEGERFVRYDIGSEREAAPGGGRVGMGADEIRRLYKGRVEEQPHKYDPIGRYLRVTDPDAGEGVLLFEIDGRTRQVTEWRVGLPPQVDYVEGCA